MLSWKHFRAVTCQTDRSQSVISAEAVNVDVKSQADAAR